jgi:hypothetical protein
VVSWVGRRKVEFPELKSKDKARWKTGSGIGPATRLRLAIRVRIWLGLDTREGPGFGAEEQGPREGCGRGRGTRGGWPIGHAID